MTHKSLKNTRASRLSKHKSGSILYDPNSISIEVFCPICLENRWTGSQLYLLDLMEFEQGCKYCLGTQLTPIPMCELINEE